MPAKTLVKIADHELTLSNLDKVFYPATGFTKGQMIDYYIRVAPVLLPHLAGRPVTLKRYPDGADDDFFYQKECPSHRPEWVPTAPVWSEGNNRNINFCLLADTPALVWAANLAALELHTSLSLAVAVATPTMMVFDLDPGPPATIIDCARVALWIKDIFDRYGLTSLPKTSGSKGLQVYVPLNTPTDYDHTKAFARALAQLLEKQHPDRVVSRMTKALRAGKVLVDWSQNDEHKTTVCVYSLRARPTPTVSTPVTWDEVTAAWEKRDAAALTFEAGDVLDRVGQLGDLFAPVLTLKQKLPSL
ncbi:non-homologous end-joining DNA ligase [Anaeroselena agilis]|uniref:Non-homologous end-joining DNA ligase n=1 Tax=Anaeroselena agilis TaxID=3063788 RepID=A0ABU3NUH6_9FIRM|nr:non-homologous end-joining DNA ligase [Selenomonadales bacterium 4137-cl]